MATIAELIDAYVDHPKKLKDAVKDVTNEQLKARPVPGKWSILEVVCHLADFEPVYVDRMKRVIAQDRPLLMGADEKLFAAKLAYHDRDLNEELRLIELTRNAFARILRTLPAEAFERVGVHSERGLKSLRELLEIINYHIPHHLPFIQEKRQALGLGN